MSKITFGKKVKSYLKAAGYSQKVLAKELVINSSLLTHKLNGTGRTVLTQPEVREIIKTLAKLESITCQSDAIELLAEVNCPNFAPEEWKKAPLNNLSFDKLDMDLAVLRIRKQDLHGNLDGKNTERVEAGKPKVINFNQTLKDTAVPNNLPKALNSFVGREREINEVIQHLIGPASKRLLTLTGVGGTGKTRLALAISHVLLSQTQFSSGIFFISLENITQQPELINELALTLGVKDIPGKTQLEALKTYLAERACLLILDNFEQLVQASPFLKELLNSSPGLNLLVTSRIALQLSLEQEYPVEPLPLPNQAEIDLLRLEQNAAVGLFILRAKSVSPDFSLDDENKTALIKICQKLDGLPLAIELAAAKVRVFSPQKLLERLSLKILSGGSRDLPVRQQTLQSTIKWGFKLLTSDEQRLFARLSIFTGGFTLEAAEAVCTAENDLAIEAFEGIESLLTQSFLTRKDTASRETRYGMLQTILEYGQDKLREQGEFARITENYINYYVELADKIEPELTGKEQATFLKLVDNEYDNYRSILSDFFKNIKNSQKNIAVVERPLKLVASLGQYWNSRGYLSEGRRYLEEALALAEIDENLINSSSIAKILNSLGLIYTRQGELKLASQYFEKSLASSRRSKIPSLIASTLHAMTGIWENLGDYIKARQYAEESLKVYREIGDKQGIARTTHLVGWLYFWPGDNDTGKLYLEDSLRLAQEIGDYHVIIFALNSLALIKTYTEGDTVTAYQNSQRALALGKEIGLTYGVEYSLLSLGMIAFAAGEYDKSHQYFEEYLALCLETGDKRQFFYIFLYQGHIAFATGEYAKAFQYFQDSLQSCLEINAKSYFVFALAGLAGIGYVQLERSSDSDKSKILLYCARMCGIINNLLNSTGIVLRQPELGYYEKAVQTARIELGVEAFNVNFAAGEAIKLEKALEYAKKELC